MLLFGIAYLLQQKAEELNQLWPYVLVSIKKPFSIIFISSAILLMFINYGLETYKWKMFLRQPMYSFKYHFKALLAGGAISVFLPFRTGEYLGRIIFFPKRLWGRVILSSVRSGMFQLSITILVGLLCLLFARVDHLIFLSSSTLTFISVLMLVLVFFIIKYLEPIMQKLFAIFNLKFRIFKGELFLKEGIWISALRYLVFLTQYILLFMAFDVASYELVLLWIPIYLLIQAIVPTVFITEMGLRAALSVFIFEKAEALVPILAIYMINILVPAILGSIFLRGAKA